MTHSRALKVWASIIIATAFGLLLANQLGFIG